MNMLYKVVRMADRTSVFASGRYRRVYELGEIVSAMPHTLGLMCFQYARDAAAYVGKLYGHGVIIKVEALSEVRIPAGVAKFPQDCSEYGLDYFYISQDAARGEANVRTVDAPEGTVLCHKIRVLD